MAILKQNSKNVFRVVRFHTMTLFFFDFPFNFLKSSLATQYEACFFSLLDVLREIKRVLAFTQMFGLNQVAP